MKILLDYDRPSHGRPYHTLSVPDNMISESLLVLIVPKPASRTCAAAGSRQQRNGPEEDFWPGITSC